MANVIINGQPIPWSFIQRLRREVFGGDWDRTIDAFWKAKHCTGENSIIRYINAGLKPDKEGKRYTLVASAERDQNGMKVIQKWWDTSVYKPKPREKSLQSIREVFALFTTPPA
jgi:hypothetical protein